MMVGSSGVLCDRIELTGETDCEGWALADGKSDLVNLSVVCVTHLLPVVHLFLSPGHYLGGGAVDVREEGWTSFEAAVDCGAETRRQYSEDIV